MSELHTATFELEDLLPGPFFCAECAARVCTDVSRLTGVLESSCDEDVAALHVTYDPSLVNRADLESSVERLAVETTGSVGHAAYRITGLD